MMTEEDFDALKPIQNHLDSNASLEGTMFETFGAELEFVKQQPDNRVWTYGEEDDIVYLQSGFHWVNRLGYIVTELPYLGEYTTIRLADLSDGNEELEDEMREQDGNGFE